MALNLYITIRPPDLVSRLLEMTHMDWDFLKLILFVAITNTFATLIWEDVLVRRICLKVKRWRYQREKNHRIKHTEDHLDPYQ